VIRAVLDTNVLISAALSSSGAPAELLHRWRGGDFELIGSAKLIDELSGVLRRPKFKNLIEAATIREFVAVFAGRATLVQDPTPKRVAHDVDDDYLIALARGAADILVTGDKPILALRITDLPILSPRAFLEVL